MRGARIVGTGRELPPRVVKNEELTKLMDTTDEWIVQRTGIRERRYADPGTGTSHPGAAAAGEAVGEGGGGVGGAGVGGPAEGGKGILSPPLHSEGKFAGELCLAEPGFLRNPWITHEMIDAGRHFPKMNGRYVFAHAVRRFPEAIREALAKKGCTVSDPSLLLPHQANLRR